MQWHTSIGYEISDGKIVVSEEHSKTVKWIFQEYDSGIPANRIAQVLIDKKVPNSHGRVAWTHVAVGKILENHNYLGTEYYSRIMEQDLFERVQKRRELVKIQYGHGQYRKLQQEKLLFSGVLVCGTCGADYHHYMPPKEKKMEPKWKCKNYIRKNSLFCVGGFITDEQVRQVCVDAINQIIKKPRLIKAAPKEKQVSAYYRRLERQVKRAKVEGADNLMKLLFERAAERYRTLEIQDEELQTEKMKEVLKGRTCLQGFDEELYRKLIQQIVVYKDNSTKVIFLNGSSVNVKYGSVMERKGEADGDGSNSQENIPYPGKTGV